MLTDYFIWLNISPDKCNVTTKLQTRRVTDAAAVVDDF